jgi:hypothetical protein
MPGERRGGRTRATPNRRSILADRMMAVLAGCSLASPKECLSKLVNDAELPADIRMAVAQVVFPDRTGSVRRARQAKSEVHTVGGSQQRELRTIEAPSAASLPVETMSRAARDALLGIVSDASASAKARRKTAVKLAAYFLSKKPVNKRWRFTADECGFAINAEIAREYRAIDFELRDLKRHPSRDFPEIAQRLRRLQARIDAIVSGFNVLLRRTTGTRMRSVSGLNVPLRRATGTRNFRMTGSSLKRSLANEKPVSH